MIEISKELLSEVFTDNQQDFKVNKIEKNILHYSWLMEECFGDGDVNCKWIDMNINIYELAHKCKEWAYNKGIMLVSGYYPNGNAYCSTNNTLKGVFNESRADTEVEAVILASEWILKEIKK